MSSPNTGNMRRQYNTAKKKKKKSKLKRKVKGKK